VKRTVLLTAAVAALAAAPPGVPASTPTPQARSAAFTYIHCLNESGSRYVRKRKPARCAHYGRGGTFGGGVDLKNIRWSSYTGRQARGRATECGFRQRCSNIPVRVRAYRVREACGRRVYTRLRAISRYGTTVVRLARCPRAA
jgi:hypothetical protein